MLPKDMFKLWTRGAELALDDCQTPSVKELVEFTLRAGISSGQGRIYNEFRRQCGVSKTEESLIQLAVFGNTVALVAWREREIFRRLSRKRSASDSSQRSP